MGGGCYESTAMNLKDKRILLTGGSGFLGRHVRARLWAMGCTENLCTPLHADWDLTNREAVDDYFGLMLPDVVIHCAASVGGIGANQKHPGQFFYDNMAMGINIIDACAEHCLEKLVVIGTCCSYPWSPEHIPFVEEDLFNGYPERTNSAYGIAKRSLLTMLQAYRSEFGLNGIYLILANLYGPGDNFDLQTSHVIPAMVRKFVEAEGKPVTLWGTGWATREFLYVKDAAEAIVQATERYDGAEAVNVGTGEEISIEALAVKIAALCDYGGAIHWDNTSPDGQPRRCLDTSRAEKAFGWRAKTELVDGLKETVAWYRTNRLEKVMA